MRLDPNYAPCFPAYLANGYWLVRRYDETIAAYQDALRHNPNAIYAHQNLALVSAELGKEKDAQAEAAEVLRINPRYSMSWLRHRLPVKNQADLDRWISGVQKAGLK